jgi:hypothetical protein
MTQDNLMTREEIPTHPTLEDFKDNTELQKYLANAFDIFCELCAATAESKGFHEDEKRMYERIARDTQLHDDRQTWLNDHAWLENQLVQAEIGRAVSEFGEAIEGVRKPGPDSHLPQHLNWITEFADVFIRAGDTLGKRRLTIGQCIIDKMLYNLTRPYKHGKNS